MLAEEREILRKAAAFFSRQPPVSGLRPLRRVELAVERGVPTPPLGINGDNTKRWILRR